MVDANGRTAMYRAASGLCTCSCGAAGATMFAGGPFFFSCSSTRQGDFAVYFALLHVHLRRMIIKKEKGKRKKRKAEAEEGKRERKDN